MRFSVIGVFIFLLTILMATAAISQAQQDTRIADWSQDLDYLIERLEAMHPNIYANISQADFKAHADSIKKRIPDLTDTEMVFAVHELMALIQDMHTGIPLWEGLEDDIVKNLQFYPLVFYRFEDGIHIASVDEKYQQIVGKKVIKFNNLSSEETFERIIPLLNADNFWGKLNFTFFFLSTADGLEYVGVENAASELSLRLQNLDGSEFTHVLKPIPFAEALPKIYFGGMGRQGEEIVYMNGEENQTPALYMSNPNDAYWYRYLPEEKAMYVCLLSMQPKSPGDFDRFYAELLQEIDKTKAEKLILDVRNNDGGDHFELPLMKGVIARPHLDQPDKLFIIQGRATGSASQHFVTQFSMYTNATFIGENTGGKPNHYGAQRHFKLPHASCQSGHQLFSIRTILSGMSRILLNRISTRRCIQKTSEPIKTHRWRQFFVLTRSRIFPNSFLSE